MFAFLFLLAFYFSFAQKGPTPRSSAHLFYFKPTQSLILVDGYEKGTIPLSGRAETWSWKNNQWNKIDSTDQPVRSLSAAAYLPDKEMIFIYGGIGKNGYDDSLRDAYTFDGKRWNKMANKSFGTRDHHEMAYDENSRSIIVYGGQTGNRMFDEQTWIFRDDQWKALNIPGPGPRVHHAMAYDEERKKIVLYGGFGDHTDYDDTWEFDGSQWKKMISSTSPGPRGHHSMVYDPSRKKILLFGGEMGMNIKGDVWAWDGRNWEKLSNNGPARILPAVAFDPRNNKLYVFGGNGGDQGELIYSDLWEWDGKSWTRVEKGKIYKWDMQNDRYVISE